MTPARARWLLEHPLDYAENLPPAYVQRIAAPDGALLTVVLAVDR